MSGTAEPIGIAGAGAFGTALAVVLGRAGHPVTLWARDARQVASMRRLGANRSYLPDHRLPEAVTPTDDIAALAGTRAVLLAVPAQRLAAFLGTHGAALAGLPLVAACKGISLDTLQGPSSVIAAACPDATVAVLSGPAFASDIAAGLPTAMTLACANARTGARLQRMLSTPTLRLYRTTDVTGTELGGALKNVIAIAAGIVIGAGLGDSARAALMTRGQAEVLRLARHRGAKAATLSGLSGLGDLVLTCTSERSRNFRFGLALGRGHAFDPALTVEGAATARAVARIAAEAGLDMPLTTTVAAILDQRLTLAGAIDALLSRPLKEE